MTVNQLLALFSWDLYRSYTAARVLRSWRTCGTWVCSSIEHSYMALLTT
jgi:hypothetical protein